MFDSVIVSYSPESIAIVTAHAILTSIPDDEKVALRGIHAQIDNVQGIKGKSTEKVIVCDGKQYIIKDGIWNPPVPDEVYEKMVKEGLV